MKTYLLRGTTHYSLPLKTTKRTFRYFDNKIMSIKPSFTMLKRSVKALDRLRPNISQFTPVQFIWWPSPPTSPPSPSFPVLMFVTMMKTGELQIHIYWETEHFVHALWFVIIWVSSVSAAASTFLFGTKKCEANQPQCRLDCRAVDSMMSQPDLKVLWKIPTSLKTEEFQWNSLQDSSR